MNQEERTKDIRNSIKEMIDLLDDVRDEFKDMKKDLIILNKNVNKEKILINNIEWKQNKSKKSLNMRKTQILN